MVEKSSHREEIYQIGRELADCGEKAIGDAALARNRLQLSIFANLRSGAITVEESRLLRGDVETMSQVIKTARSILKLRGEDTESILRNRILKASFGKLGDQQEDGS